MHEKNGELEKRIQSEGDSFVTSSEEEVIVVIRRHWFILAIPLISSLLLGLFAIVSFFLVRSVFTIPFGIIIASGIVIFVLLSTIATKLIVDWYYHLYVVTTHKIIEICYAPLFSHMVNEILLEQVRCTEIDVRINGIVDELLDKGDVIITFDRPTHQEEFTLSQIQSPQKIAINLGNVLDSSTKNSVEKTTWLRGKDKPHRYRFTEELPFGGRKQILGNAL